MNSPRHEQYAPQPGVLRIESWAQYPWIRAGFSTRLGGHSRVYSGNVSGELNLGWTEADSTVDVARNREDFVRELAGDGFELVTIGQLHGEVIRGVDRKHGPLTSPEGKAILRGDGLMTSVPGLLLGIQTADCVPVLVADT